MGKKPVLGKGISALIPEYAEPSGQGDASRQIIYLNVDEIEPNPYQARTEFDEESIDELMHSIQEKGVIQPITVNRIGQSYQIIAGERRWRATKKGGDPRNTSDRPRNRVSARFDGAVADREHPARRPDPDRRGRRLSLADRQVLPHARGSRPQSGEKSLDRD